MIEAQANIMLGEAIRPAAGAHRRVYGGGSLAVVAAACIFAFASLAAMLIAAWLAPYLGRWTGIISILGFIAGAMGAIAFYSRVHLSGFLKGLRKLGSPDVLRTRFRFDEQGVAVHTDRMSHSLPWTAVQFIVPAPDHWLLQVDTTTLAVPRRAFARSEDEQAFLELAGSHLSPAALEHSVLDSQ